MDTFTLMLLRLSFVADGYRIISIVFGAKMLKTYNQRDLVRCLFLISVGAGLMTTS